MYVRTPLIPHCGTYKCRRRHGLMRRLAARGRPDRRESPCDLQHLPASERAAPAPFVIGSSLINCMYHMHCLKPHNASVQPPNDLSCNHTQVNPYMATPRRCRGYSSSNLLWGASLVQVACPLYNWQVVVVLVCPASTGTKASSHYIFTCGGHHLLQLAPMLD